MTKKTVQLPNRVKSLSSPVLVPQSRDAVAQAISEIGIAQRHRQRIEAAMNDEIAASKLRYETEAQPYNEKIQSLRSGIQIYCEAHRDELTQSGRVKFANFSSGEVKWRFTPPSVSVRAAGATVKLLIEKGLSRFVREKLEVNKEAILAEAEAIEVLSRAGIAGIAIGQKEEFVIEPFETKLEEVA